MILVVIAAWLGFLWLLVKFRILPGWALWMKISPVVIWALATLMIFIPLNWTAPVGSATVTVGSVKIVPAVAGEVKEIEATSWTPIKKDAVLFRIDPTRYQAAVRQAEAALELSKDQLARKQKLFDTKVVSAAELGALKAEVDVKAAGLVIAEQELAWTEVRAPFDGIVPAVTLFPGARVGTTSPVMAFLDIDRPVIIMILKENHLRNVRVGQKAEAVFKSYPGRTFSGTVLKIYASNPAAEYDLSGSTPALPEVIDATYAAALEMDLGDVKLPPGTSGQAAVFTDKSPATHFIRQITLRMTSWLNYF